MEDTEQEKYAHLKPKPVIITVRVGDDLIWEMNAGLLEREPGNQKVYGAFSREPSSLSSLTIADCDNVSTNLQKLSHSFRELVGALTWNPQLFFTEDEKEQAKNKAKDEQQKKG